VTGWCRRIRELATRDDGQDLIEYGMLAAGIAAVGFAIFPAVETQLGALFSQLSATVWNCWAPNDPGVSGCP
jgi:Flp pilus assembly pilin Flp